MTVTNPQKIYFPAAGCTKLDLVTYYVAVADGALRGVAGRPMAQKRFVNGVDEPPFFQKRAPDSRPEWIETVTLSFPSGHYAKQEGEPARVMPSRAKGAKAPARAKMPLIIVAKAAVKADALAGLERWKERHPEAAARLIPDDALVDAMRGRFTTWYRIRVNLRHVPETDRPAKETPDPDYTPTW